MLCPIAKVALLAIPVSYIVHCYLSGTLIGSVAVAVVAVLVVALAVLLLGLTKNERMFLFKKLHIL